MTPRNSYATLAEYQAYSTAYGQTTPTNAADDAVIETLLEAASNYIDDETQRRFAPFVQTRYYDTPTDRELMLDEDLLEVLTLTNGDNANLPSTEYNLVPRNITPHYAVKITDISSYTWTSNAQGSFEDAVSVGALWGYHDKYNRDAWKVGSTAAEALDVSETEIDVTSAALFASGQIVRVDNELMLVTSTATGKINVERGYNGSTAATHDSGASVRIYQVMQSAKLATLEITAHAYKRRFGKSQSNTETITAAGVVLTPRDIPATAAAFIAVYRERA